MSRMIKKATDLLKAGGLVAFPTETVYGLGADAANEGAVDKIFAAKGRPYRNPLIVHLAHLEMLSDWALDISPAAYQLARAFWPGPLTLILKKQDQVPLKVTGGQETVGLRVPRHPVALALLESFGGGIAAPSANRYTRISPTTAQAVTEEVGDKVDLILDGGDCEVGLESTIVDMTQANPVVLRPGMICASEIAKVLGLASLVSNTSHNVIAPGMDKLHYAPRKQTYLVARDHIDAFIASKITPRILSYSMTTAKNASIITMPSDPILYARKLYHSLRLADQGEGCIVIEAVPTTREWDSIRDRLNRAAQNIPSV